MKTLVQMRIYEKPIVPTVGVEVQFPFYTRHNCENGTFFSKVVSPSVEYVIYMHHDGGIDLRIDTPSWDGERAYLLGEGKYACTEETFNHTRRMVGDWLKGSAGYGREVPAII